MKSLPTSPSSFPAVLRKLAVLIATAMLLGLALMFSFVIIIIALGAGIIVWGYLSWKTRGLRKQMHTAYQDQEINGFEETDGAEIKGEVIEGEVLHRSES